MSKKVLGLALCLALAVTALTSTGCGKKQGADQVTLQGHWLLVSFSSRNASGETSLAENNSFVLSYEPNGVFRYTSINARSRSVGTWRFENSTVTETYSGTPVSSPVVTLTGTTLVTQETSTTSSVATRTYRRLNETEMNDLLSRYGIAP